MNRRGRINVLAIFGILCVGFVIVLFAFSRESLTTVGNRFMSALGRGDVNTLTDMTYMGDASKDDIRKKWDFAVNTAGKYYNFHYRITSAIANDEKSGAINMQFVKNSAASGSYEEIFQLPLVKVGEDWKVDVRGISRELYPGLPN